MKSIPSILIGIMLLVSACKKKDANPANTFSASQYFFQLKTGNFWVYQVNDPSSSHPVQIDTVKVTSDTTINGITYYQIVNGNFQGVDPGYYKDSASYIIACGGLGDLGTSSSIYKLTNHTGDTLLNADENIVQLVKQTGNPDTTINVSAGAFNSLQIISNTYYSSSYPPPAGVSSPRQSYIYFSKGIGVVFATTFFSESPDIVTSQLISYHVAQ